MYEAHFGLRSRPFRPVPDPAVYYAAAPHEDALNALRQAIADDEPFALLTGEPGLGKTLVAQVLLERLGAEIASVVVTNSHFESRSALLQALLYDLALPYEGRSEQELRIALTDCLLARLGEGQRTVALIDEAHHLSAECLEELRLLANLESPKGRALQVVLVGLPETLDALKTTALRALSQRLTARSTLGRLGIEESADYLLHQLRVAGARPEAVLAEDALELLAKSAMGVPRLLNQLAHQALMLTCQAAGGRVDVESAMEALGRLGIELPAGDEVAPPADVEMIRLEQHESPRLIYAEGRLG